MWEPAVGPRSPALVRPLLAYQVLPAPTLVVVEEEELLLLPLHHLLPF